MPRRLEISILGWDYELEALVVKPSGTGPLPLAVISHGKPRQALERRSLRLRFLLPIAEDFARRGYYTVVFARRGYASSTSAPAELSVCENHPGSPHVRAGSHDADEYQAVIETLAQEPEIDASRTIAVGQSTGGFAAMALASREFEGLVGVINFAGGRGSTEDFDVCNVDGLVSALAKFGGSARVPALWLYSESDRYFWPHLVGRMFAAYADGGAPVRLEMVGPLWFTEDGHELVNLGGRQLWRPRIDAFLDLIGAQNWRPPDDVTVPNWDPPRSLRPNDQSAWRRYLGLAGHKAFAVGPDGAYGWSANDVTPELARSQALRFCEAEARPCRVVSVAGGRPGPLAGQTVTGSTQRGPGIRSPAGYQSGNRSGKASHQRTGEDRPGPKPQ